MLSLTHNLKVHLTTTKRRKETSRGHCWYHYFMLYLLKAGLGLNIRPLPQQQKAHQHGPPFLRKKRPSMVPTPLSTALSTWPRPKECLRPDLATIGKRGSPSGWVHAVRAAVAIFQTQKKMRPIYRAHSSPHRSQLSPWIPYYVSQQIPCLAQTTLSWGAGGRWASPNFLQENCCFFLKQE